MDCCRLLDINVQQLALSLVVNSDTSTVQWSTCYAFAGQVHGVITTYLYVSRIEGYKFILLLFSASEDAADLALSVCEWPRVC